MIEIVIPLSEIINMIPLGIQTCIYCLIASGILFFIFYLLGGDGISLLFFIFSVIFFITGMCFLFQYIILNIISTIPLTNFPNITFPISFKVT